MYDLYLAKLKERGLFGRGRQDWCKMRLPQIALSLETKKVLPFVKLE